MKPDDPDRPSLLKPTNVDGPGTAFTSGMPDPFARQSAEVEASKQPVDVLDANRPNSVAAETLGGYDKTQENIYRVDSPADGRGQPQVSPEPTFPANNFNEIKEAAPPPAPTFAPAPNPTTGSDYLNQIAPQKASFGSKFFSNKFFVIGAILAVLVIATIIAVVVANNANQGPKEAAVAVGTELTDLQTLVNYGKSNAKSSTNVKSTAETSLVALTQQYSLGQIFTLTDEESTATTPEFIADLDSAKASGNVETVYTETMTNQLNDTYIALTNLDQQTTAADKKAALTQAKTDIEELYRRITE